MTERDEGLREAGDQRWTTPTPRAAKEVTRRATWISVLGALPVFSKMLKFRLPLESLRKPGDQQF